jgi:chromosome segregation ATPase
MATIKEKMNSLKDRLDNFEKLILSQKLIVNTIYEKLMQIIKDIKIVRQKLPIPEEKLKQLIYVKYSNKKEINKYISFINQNISWAKSDISNFHKTYKDSLEITEFRPILVDYINKFYEYQKYSDDIKSKFESLNGGYYEKYLKYKQKYLELKSRI